MRASLPWVAALLAAAPLGALTEADLQRLLAGRTVTVALDMPADQSGVDVLPDSSPKVDFAANAQRIQRFGVGVRRGASAMITNVRVRKKEIEVHLDGGGFVGTSPPYMNTSVPKSSRERQLEDEVKRATDPTQKRQLENQLRDLRNARNREETRLRAEAEQARILHEAAEQSRRLQGGSRFRIRFGNNVPAGALTPESIEQILSGLARFDDAAPAGAPPTRDAAAPFPVPAVPNPLDLRKGMSLDEVADLFDEPSGCEKEQAAGLEIAWCLYELDGADLRVQFAGGALVKYVLESQ